MTTFFVVYHRKDGPYRICQEDMGWIQESSQNRLTLREGESSHLKYLVRGHMLVQQRYMLHEAILHFLGSFLKPDMLLQAMSGSNPDISFSEPEQCNVPFLISNDGYREFIVEESGSRVCLGSSSYLVEPGDSEIPIFLTSQTPVKSRKGWNYPLLPIEWNWGVGQYLWSKVKTVANQRRFFDLAYSELLGINEPWRSNLHSLLVNVYSYTLAVKEENMDLLPEEIIRRSLTEGPEFAEFVSGLKSWLMKIKYNREYFSDDLQQVYEKFFTHAKFERVGDIFRCNQLFYWTPPSPDIVAITSEDVDEYPELTEEFRICLREYLQETDKLFFEPDNEYKFLYQDNTKKNQFGPNWATDPVVPANRRDRSRVAFIPRELSEQRAAVVETPASALRIRWIDSEVRRLLSLDKRSKMETRPNVLLNQLIDAIRERTRWNHKTRTKDESQRWSYCRDFRKEGLTKNRTLSRIMLEELHRRFPTSEAFAPFWFFDLWEFELKGVVYHANKGHGLGMQNALTTLMQITIEKIVKKRCRVEPTFSAYNNDDAAFVFESEEIAREYAFFDRNVCDGLGLSYKPKSTFLCRKHIVLCEQYGSEDYRLSDKTSFSYDTLFLLTKAINASHARELAMSMNLSRVPTKLVELVTSYWGPVLFKNEFQRPRSLGGWFRSIEKGVDISFININGNANVPQMEESAAYAYNETKLIYEPWLFRPKRLTKRAMVFPTEWLESADEELYLKSSQLFKAETNVKENVRAWTKFQEILNKNFKKACSWWAKKHYRRRSYHDLYKSECDARPKEDIIPPIGYRTRVKGFEASYTNDITFEHPFRIVGQSIDLRLWKSNINKESYNRKMGITDQISLGSAKDSKHMKRGPAQRAITMRHLLGTKIPLKVWNLYLVPNEDTFKYWHHPFSIGTVSDAWGRNYNSYIPEYISEEKQKLLEMRDQVYGKPLTWKEWMEVGSIHPSDQIYLSILKDRWLDENIYDKSSWNMINFCKFLKLYPGSGRYLNKLQSYSGEAIYDFLEKWAIVQEVLKLKKKPTRDEEKEFERRQNALFEKLEIDEDDIAVTDIRIKNHYADRENMEYYQEDDNIYEEVQEVDVDELLEQFYEPQEEEIPEVEFISDDEDIDFVSEEQDVPLTEEDILNNLLN